MAARQSSCCKSALRGVDGGRLKRDPWLRVKNVGNTKSFSLALVVVVAALGGSSSAVASHTPDPSSVTIAGSMQSELGCSGDWQPDCALTHLAYDTSDDVWQATFAVPVGNWEYKAALNDSWDENYGANTVQNGSNIPLTLGAGASVKFYYDHKSHWATDNRNSVIAVAAGSFQSELGCPGDWQPDCLRSWLQDPDGDGTYSFTTPAIPAGNYEAKVAINEDWAENYGAGGAPNGSNIPFSVSPGAAVCFSYVSATHLLSVTGTDTCPPETQPPALSTTAAPTGQHAAAKKHCKKKFPKGPKRKKCLKKAKRLPI